MLKIVTVPNPTLNKPSVPVISFDTWLKKLVKEMEKTLDAQVDPQGVGLAAPQIGENIQVFIMKPTEEAIATVCVNPKIIKLAPAVKIKKGKVTAKKDKRNKLEGCLSVPRFWSPIKRPVWVELEYQDINGNIVVRKFKGFEAIIIQHEVDHLEGVLFTQRALEQKSLIYEEDEENKLKTVSI